MRKTVLAVLTPLLLFGAAGCFAPPTPPRATPAPTLPQESIAYDDLPVVTDRPTDYLSNCDRINGTPGLAQKLGYREPPTESALEPGCSGATPDFGTIIVKPTGPTKRISDPWDSEWNSAGGIEEHFRRIILADRYYAVTHATWRIAGPGCTVVVNLGGRELLDLTYLLPQERNADFEAYVLPSAANLARATCPQAERMSTDLLAALDPNGGSRAG